MAQGTGIAGITQLIGNTPLLRIRMFEREFPRVEVYAKAEWFNPGGSVKDRAALAMIEDGEQRGALTHDKTIIDSTSGNTGIAYAMVAAAKGYRVKLVMPANGPMAPSGSCATSLPPTLTATSTRTSIRIRRTRERTTRARRWRSCSR